VDAAAALESPPPPAPVVAWPNLSRVTEPDWSSSTRRPPPRNARSWK